MIKEKQYRLNIFDQIKSVNEYYSFHINLFIHNSHPLIRQQKKIN